MTASAYPSSALDVAKRTQVFGFQAGCDDCSEPKGNVYLGSGDRGRWVGWVGEFCDTWIAAKLEAVVHNIEKHPRPQPSWEEIIHGHTALRT